MYSCLVLSRCFVMRSKCFLKWLQKERHSLQKVALLKKCKEAFSPLIVKYQFINLKSEQSMHVFFCLFISLDLRKKKKEITKKLIKIKQYAFLTR